MQTSIPEFGAVVPGQAYILRPGGYGVIRNDTGSIAVVVTPQGTFLPGGGQEADETPEQAMIREVREECGLEIQVSDCIGIADELVLGREEKAYFRKRCTFFAAQAVGMNEAGRIEPDHKLVWLPVADAAAQLTHASQRWAVKAGKT
jgi:8-oxo-dGTP diphosphatase